MKLSKAITLYIEDVRMNRSASTATGYESDLRRLAALAQQDTILHFTPDLIDRYLKTSSAAGVKMSTLYRKHSSLREFAKWGIAKRLWLDNPMTGIRRPPKPRHVPRPFSNDEVRGLLALELSPAERVLRALLLFTGLRVTPICTLKVGDVSYDPPQLRALVKGARVQIVPMRGDLAELVRDHVLSQSDLKGQSPLVRQKSGRPYGRKLVEKITQRWGDRSEPRVPDCTPHRFRHTYATAMLLVSGGNLRLVQEALGHRDISSTTIYTQLHGGAVSDAVGRLPWSVS